MMAPALVSTGHDGALTTTSLVVADGTGNEHASVLKLIRSNLADFEEFGGVGFEIAPFETAGGTQRREFAVLNEEQATLLMTYMRNSDVVREFKKNLVRAFYELRTTRSALPSTRELAQMVIAAEDAREVAEKQAAIETKARQAMESYAKDLEPRAEGYDQWISGDGTYSVGNVAKMLGTSQNKLYDELRNNGVLIAKGAMRNTPYQKYMHHFAVKATEYERSDGNRGTGYTTRVQPSGVAFIARKVGRSVQTEVSV